MEYGILMYVLGCGQVWYGNVQTFSVMSQSIAAKENAKSVSLRPVVEVTDNIYWLIK